jgi:hypothetical protein
MPKLTRLTRPSFLRLASATWYLVKLDGPMETIPLPGKKPDHADVFPVSVYNQGALPLPEQTDLLGFLMRTPLGSLVPANMAVGEAFADPASIGQYFLMIFSGQKGEGNSKYNVWEINRLEFDQAEKDTLEGKGDF